MEKGFEFDIINYNCSEYEMINNTIISFYTKVVLCFYTEIKESDLRSNSNKKINVIPRQIIIYFVRKYHPLISYKYLSTYFGRECHSTSLSAFKRISGYIETDKKFRLHIIDIENKILEQKGVDLLFYQKNKVNSEMDIEILKKAIAKWGAVNQINKIHEEALELALAIVHFQCITKNKDETIENVYDELADMEIMSAQARLIFDSDRIEEKVKFKMQRLKLRLCQ